MSKPTGMDGFIERLETLESTSNLITADAITPEMREELTGTLQEGIEFAMWQLTTIVGIAEHFGIRLEADDE